MVHILSAEWSKKLFTIIHYELQNSRCIVTQELRAYIFSDNSSNFVHIVFVGSDPGYFILRPWGQTPGISYPEKVFGKPKALRAFLSTDVSLSTDEILSYYVCRWPIEVFFRQCEDKLALDNYQIRSAQGIRRYWLIMSLTHYMCVIGNGESSSFENGHRQICDVIQLEKYRYIFQCAKASNDFDAFMKVTV